MVRLTSLKLRRMSLGLRQIDVVLSTGIHASRVSQIENELVTPSERESELLELFFQEAKRAAAATPSRVRSVKEVQAEA